ncbi:hypothetical protein [Dyadobacter crusticola]|uniref:hypothetical protein n=1 Tax=Dyadobacter crusticola TaxID=292407 RepID=UPI0004E1842F|nr:hypothetical protein [Dyadobacter crusticola]
MKATWILLMLLLNGASDSLCLAQNARRFFPDYVTVQYAGSTGWMGFGTGYNLFKDHARLGVQYGFVPKEAGGNLQIVSASLFFKPITVRISDHILLNPLDIGTKVGYHFGDQFYVNWPKRFPRGYYWWKSAVRLHLTTESSFTYKIKKGAKIKSITAYLELNATDLYLISYVQNLQSLSLPDIVKAGVGMRVNF